MFTVYSKKGCPWCSKARRLLSRFGYKYKVRYPGKDELKEITGGDTYPQIYNGRAHVGGFEHLQRYVGIVRVPGATWKLHCAGCRGRRK